VPGATLHHVLAVLYGATVTLSDSSSPSLTNVSGSLFAGGYLTGTRSVSFDASDNVGIRSARFFVDGQPQPSVTYPCDFTYTVPCSNRNGASLQLDTTTLSDGTHSVEVAVSDPAGNEVTSSPHAITVDNGAPAAPQGLAADGGDTKTVNDYSVAWTNPGGQVAPIVAAHWQLCSAEGGQCSAGVASGQDVSRIDGLSVPGPGDWRLSVWLEDEVGNVSASNAAGVTLRFSENVPAGTSPTAPGASSPDPRLDPTAPNTTTTFTDPVADQTVSSFGPIAHAAPRLSPHLRLDTAAYRHGRLVLTGRTASGAAGRATVRVRAGRRILAFRRRLRGGPFRIVLRVKTPQRVSISYTGTVRFLPQRIARGIR
jgi:hypothetical protein